MPRMRTALAVAGLLLMAVDAPLVRVDVPDHVTGRVIVPR